LDVLLTTVRSLSLIVLIIAITWLVLTLLGANFKAAANWLTAGDSFQCLAHTIQLAVNAVFSGGAPGELFGKLHQFVVAFRRSSRLLEELARRQEQRHTVSLHLIEDVCTRWNSRFHMAQRFLKLQPFLFEMALDKMFSEFEAELPTLSDVNGLQACCVLLEEFERLTVELSGETYVTISTAPIQIHRLLNKTLVQHAGEDETVGKLRAQLLVESTRSLGWILTTCNIALQAAALDPRYSKLEFISSDIREEVWKSLAEQATHLENEVLEQEYMLLALKSIWVELERQSALLSTEDPLQWWKNKSKSPRYAAVARLARALLAIPATSTASERAFSTAGHIFSKKRGRLAVERVEMLVFVRENLNILSLSRLKELYDKMVESENK
jgi:hAT family protein